MAKEKYIINIGEEGSVGLGKLDYCFNATTKEFLIDAGLRKGMHVLDIGCGSGVMTCWTKAIPKLIGKIYVKQQKILLKMIIKLLDFMRAARSLG